MCHHYETRELAALREELAEANDDEAADEADLTAEPVADPADADEPRDRLPPIQPSD